MCVCENVCVCVCVGGGGGVRTKKIFFLWKALVYYCFVVIRRIGD